MDVGDDGGTRHGKDKSDGGLPVGTLVLGI